MGARDLLRAAGGAAARTLRTIARAVEGEPRPGPYYLPISGGYLPDGASTNWWQEGLYVQPLGTRQAMVEACVSAYSQTVAMCPWAHWRLDSKGSRFPSFFEETGVIKESWTWRFFCEKNQKPPIRWK